MNRTTRAGAAVLAITAMGLAGCGRDAAPAPGASSKPAASVSAGPATGTVEVWAMGTEGEKLEAFAADFVKENPEVKIKVTAIPWDAAHDKIATAIAGAQTPDVSMIGTTWMGEFAATDALDATPAGVDPASFFKGAWDGTKVGGTSYGVPWYVETRVLYYRTDLAGKEAPKDWKGLADFAAKIKAAGGKWGLSVPPGKTGAWQTFMPFAWQAGAKMTSDDGKTFTIDSPEFVKALAFYQSLFKDGLAPTDRPDGVLETDFVKGDIGAFVSGPWHVGLLKDAGGADFMSKVALAPLPADAQSASFIGGANLAVFKDSKNRDASWKFVQWLSKPEVQVKWYKTVNDLPSVASAWDDSAIASDQYLTVFGEQLKTAVAPPSIPTWEEVAGVIDTQLEKLAKTDADPQAIATAIQQQAAAIGTGL